MQEANEKMAVSAESDGSKTAILHIFVVGFHHQKGSTVEFSHPPLGGLSSPERLSITSLLPPEWKHLPHLALPDGCHNYDEDASFFTLPSLSNPERYVYGVACCRQIDARELAATSEDVTRSTVQKSICVLCRFPVFGFIDAKLKLITHAYFNDNFSDVSILYEAYEQLNTSISSQSALKMTQMGLSPREQVIRYEHRLLQIFKALLLQKRVLVLGSPARKLSNAILAMASLFPLSLESILNPRSQYSRDEYGFPLGIFSQGGSLQPYMCLQQMDVLTESNSNCLLVGVVNPLYEKQHSKTCDVFATFEDRLITVNDQELKSALRLTTADLRFCSLLLDTIRGGSSPVSPQHSEWVGSDEWVLAQFKFYLVSLLATSVRGDSPSIDDFNREFVTQWRDSPAYKAWLESGHQKIYQVEPMHICEGDLSLGDLKRRLLAQASDYGLGVPSKEQVAHVMQETQRVISETAGRVSSTVSSMWSATSSSLSSWWWAGSGRDSSDTDKKQ